MKKFFFFLLPGIFVACQRDVDPLLPEPDQKCRLTKMIQGTHNGGADDTTYTFHYNDTGRLDTVYYTFLTDAYRIPLSYDGSGRLTQSWAEFEYNAKGQLAAFVYFDRYEFIYGSNDLPNGVKIYSRYDGNSPWTLETEITYTFQNGNMVKAENIRNGQKEVTTFEYYDNLPNNKALALLNADDTVNFGWWEVFCFFNKNLLKKRAKAPAYEIEYTMDAGRIARSDFYWLDDDNKRIGHNTRNFFYECK